MLLCLTLGAFALSKSTLLQHLILYTDSETKSIPSGSLHAASSSSPSPLDLLFNCSKLWFIHPVDGNTNPTGLLNGLNVIVHEKGLGAQWVPNNCWLTRWVLS